MTTIVLLVALVAALACPLHMLWEVRRGRRPGCLVARDGCARSLGVRQRRLAERVGDLASPHRGRGSPSSGSTLSV